MIYDKNDPKLKEICPDGQQADYLVLTPGERAKGFVRPIRNSYKHLACGSITHMGLALAETYARDPEFYTSTYCVHCQKHFQLIDEAGQYAFLWDTDGLPVGS